MSGQSFASLFDQFSAAIDRLPADCRKLDRYKPMPGFNGFHGLAISPAIRPNYGTEFDLAADHLAEMDPALLAELQKEWEQ